jgi:hypothetical protein
MMMASLLRHPRDSQPVCWNTAGLAAAVGAITAEKRRSGRDRNGERKDEKTGDKEELIAFAVRPCVERPLIYADRYLDAR